MTPRTMSRFTGAFPPALLGIARGGPWSLAAYNQGLPGDRSLALTERGRGGDIA